MSGVKGKMDYFGTRVVIKYGTNALASIGDSGKVLGLNEARISDIARFVNAFFENSIEPILVSSGAVVAGMVMKGVERRPANICELQLLAAIGQPFLMAAYYAALKPYGTIPYQVLPTHHNFRRMPDRENISVLVELGFANREIAIFNTNDALTNYELVPKNGRYGFSDNDPLASLVAIHCRADSLFIVSEDGALGSGGSYSKKKALRMAEKAGIRTRVLTHQELEKLVDDELEKRAVL